MSNVFERIIKKEISAEILYETENVIAFKDLNPVAPVHIVIIPKKFGIKNVNDLDVYPLEAYERAVINSDDMLIVGEMFYVAKEVAILKEIDKTGYRLTINNGDDAGQQVQHLHIHLIGGSKLGAIASK